MVMIIYLLLQILYVVFMASQHVDGFIIDSCGVGEKVTLMCAISSKIEDFIYC
jgi:hypothetical protein